MSQFENDVAQAAQKAVLKIIADGSWIAPDYSNRFKIPPQMLDDVYGLIKKESLLAALKVRIETELADRIVNHIAAEMATDIKQILSVKDRREALRAIARNHIDSIMEMK